MPCVTQRNAGRWWRQSNMALPEVDTNERLDGSFPRLAQAAGRYVGFAGRPIIELPAGSRIYGQSPEAYLLLLEGTVRVQQVSENGREIVLY